ncbi:glycosyltransferase [Proteobacteria bacterium 005FR1]|nr:glycosyltransferase [Proteobacteria bacterium 005FR1]
MSISVVTATFNCASTLGDCLDSVAGQTWPNVEHLVIDGASNDTTLVLLESRRDQFAVLVSEPDGGIYDALNKGIGRATGDIVGFLHADDVYAGPDVLTHIAEAFSDPAVSAVYGDLQYVSKENTNQVVRRWESSPFSHKSLVRGWMPPHPTLYVRRSFYESIGGFDSRYRIAADYFSILQLFSRADFTAVYLPKVLVKMRVGGASNRSLRNIVRKSREDYDALRRSGVGGLGTLAWKNLSKVSQFL